MAVKEGHKLATPVHDVEFVNDKGLLAYAKAGIATEFPQGEYDKLVASKSIRVPKNKAEEKALADKLEVGLTQVDPTAQAKATKDK